MSNFDIHDWNKKRYLGEIDSRMGPRQATMKLDQLTFNVVKSMFGEIPMFGIAFPNPDDSYRSVFNGNDLENWKEGIRDRFGNVNIKIDVEAASKWERIQILDDKFRGDKEDYIKAKGAALDNWRKSSNYGLDEELNEASYMYKGYKDKHFDICPTAEALRDELLSGKFKDTSWATGTDFETESGEWLYQHDVLFGTEKQVLKDKEGEESDIEKAKAAIDRIVNLSRDLGIPADRLGYLNDHLKIIKDVVEYSALTEKDKFAGSDPKAGSTIKGTGFMAPRQKPKDKEAIKETLRFIKENNPEFTTEEIAAELKEIKALGEKLEEEMCKRGKNYMAARKRAGEKSSAYLSGRGVKVCKGQIKGSDGKKKKSY